MQADKIQEYKQYIVCILVKHPVDGRRSVQNMSVNSNTVYDKIYSVNVHLVVCYISIKNM